MSDSIDRPDLDRLYVLLPGVVRERDFLEGEPLRALLNVIAEEVGVIESDITRLYRNSFIETCDEWVVPYLAELIAYRFPGGQRLLAGRHPRREVGKAMSYRRRSGTLALLGELAWDIAGWPSRVVQFSQQLVATATLDRKLPSARTPRIFDEQQSRRFGGPFDTVPRLRSAVPAAGVDPRANSLALYVWRGVVRRIDRADAASIGTEGRRFTFDPLGDYPVALYLKPDEHCSASTISTDDPTAGLPLPLLPRHFIEPQSSGDLGISQHIYGEAASFAIYADGSPDNWQNPVPAEDIISADLLNWKAPATERWTVAVDPELGRIMFRKPVGHVRVSYHETAPPGIGAGRWLEVAQRFSHCAETPNRDSRPIGGAKITKVRSGGGAADECRSLAAAITKRTDPKVPLIIEIQDSATYEWNVDDSESPYHADSCRLEIRAAAGCRPCIRCTDPREKKNWGLKTDSKGEIVLEGLVIKGPVLVQGTGTVSIRGCTISNSKFGDAASSCLDVECSVASLCIDRSIIGSITYTKESDDQVKLKAEDSVIEGIDGDEAAVSLNIRRCTVIGDVWVTHLELAENTLFMAEVQVAQRQNGGMRYCYVDPKISRTPRRYECQPDKSNAVPRLINGEYGEPGYAMLSDDTPASITEGADDDGEIGATHEAWHFRRLNDLRQCAADHLPAGFELQVIPISPGSELEKRT